VSVMYKWLYYSSAHKNPQHNFLLGRMDYSNNSSSLTDLINAQD
jgi:hypothetical protein